MTARCKRNSAMLAARNRAASLAVVAAALAAAALTAGSAAAAEGQRLRLGVGFTTFYTDNVLQYSDTLLQVFDQGTAPAHFSIKSTGDGVWRPSVSLTWETDRLRGRGRDLRLRFTGEFHQKNSTADVRSTSASWREYLGRDRRLSLVAYYLPSHYLRQLLDEDYVPPLPGLSKYRRAQFSLFLGSMGWRQRLARGLRGEVAYQYEHRGYNADFSERTSDSHQGEGSLELYRIPHRGSIELHGGYRKSIAKADDADALANDDPDVSYHGILAGLGGRVDLTRGRPWRLGGDAAYEYASRDYESDRPNDKSHYGRSDRLHTMELGFRVEPGRGLGLRAFYHFEDNKATFPVGGGPTSDPASYTENRVGVALDWSVVLWRSAARGAAEEPGEGR